MLKYLSTKLADLKIKSYGRYSTAYIPWNNILTILDFYASQLFLGHNAD